MSKLIIISGPSGVGKSTIRKEVINSSNNIWYSISATTREPRDGEVDGRDYFFLSKDDFFNSIKNDDFFEYVEVYDGTYYGTLKKTVMEKLNQGIDVILEIDVDGALKIKNQFSDALLIFIMPPSLDELKKRLVNRATDSLEKINERLKKAEYELSLSDRYDYIIINNDINQAVKDIKKIIYK